MAHGGCSQKRLTRFGAGVLLCAVAGAIASCDEETVENRERVEIHGRVFWLEPALDEPTRMKGLGGRESLEPDGGMLFVFRQPQPLYFVMRDCEIDIDIAFIDPTGRVTAVHEMKAEEPRREDEDDRAYELRLERYSSRFSAQAAIEVGSGTFAALGLEPGDVIELDWESLKARVR